MSASQELSKRNNKRIIEQKYISQVLREEAQNIEQNQDRIFNTKNTNRVIRKARSFIVNGTTLTHKHDIRQRFEDMKRIKSRNNKPTKAHNKTIWGYFNNIVFQLAYGFTKDVKNTIANQYNLEI